MSKLESKLAILRLPFVTASVIPFLIGAAYVFRTEHINVFNIRFFLGLFAGVFGHIGANILNDYFDSRSGGDWQDLRNHIFFGGSKAIQNGFVTEKEAFVIGAAFMALAALCLSGLQILIPNIPILLFGLFIIILAYEYTAPPLRLVYRGWGELVVFVLFGTAIVAGAYTVLTLRYFGIREILLSFPIAFLVMGILYANEVPDHQSDKKVGKRNIVVRIGAENAWIGYVIIVAGTFLSILLCVIMNILPVSSLLTLLMAAVFINPAMIIKRDYMDIEKLKISSKGTIAGHMLVGIGLIATLVFSGVAGRSAIHEPLQEYKETRSYMGSYVTIRCFYDKKTDIAPAIQQCWKRMDEIQAELNDYIDTGDIALINSLGDRGADVHDYTYRLLEKILDLSRRTDGAFDITVKPLVRLWKDAAKENRMPTEEELAQARDKVGYKNITLTPPNHVKLAREGMRIDLGGVGGGYACDEIAKILEVNGIDNFMVDGSGEILCRGKSAGNKPWIIGIQDPFDKTNIIGEFQINDRSVSTSGSYEKFYTIGEERFSHIINPVTGMPEKNVMSVTVIAPTGTEADILSTALCVSGREKGLEILRAMSGVEAMFIEKKDGKYLRYQTENFGK